MATVKWSRALARVTCCLCDFTIGGVLARPRRDVCFSPPINCVCSLARISILSFIQAGIQPKSMAPPFHLGPPELYVARDMLEPVYVDCSRSNRDGAFCFLYDRISEHFAPCLEADIGHMNSGEIRKISLSAKCCPSVGSSFGRSTIMCQGIAKLTFPRYSFPEHEGIEEAHALCAQGP